MTQAPNTSGATGQRLDKWLWHARLSKTRTLAAAFIESGKVRINRVKVLKPSQTVKPGDVITAVFHGHPRVVKVIGIVERRVGADGVKLLFEEITPSDTAALQAD